MTGHIKTTNHFMGQRKMVMMTTTLTSIGTQATKVKRPREGGFCVTFSFLGFVL
jgi:hypothetical protein